MLELKNIRKIYVTGENTLAALDGVSLCFRENEFVSILGPSGCGKTTMLNIVGGLDRYTDGDLVINGRSTKSFKDRDWDTYRNHSIGFVFQSYNLIPHQTVLENVELALTLSGVSKAERKTKAIEALKKVGLGDHIYKKPNQMSGGQMQRVAIARALVNNPDILLADEPTGALDTQTSVQIMDLLKEVANDRLVIMVTHNPELAEEYSTRIVRLSDGKVVGDTNPISMEEYTALKAKDEALIIQAKKDKKKAKAMEKTKSMSFFTAISLSFKNLLTKKGRTVLTSFAGSIGIIGIALILALSNGINIFITQIQEDTLSTYPLSIESETTNTSSMLSAMMDVSSGENKKEQDPDKIYVDDSMSNMVNAMNNIRPNNLEKFKEYIDENYDEKLSPYLNDIQYTYDLNLQTFSIVPEKDNAESNRVTKLGLGSMLENMGDTFSGMSSLVSSSGMLDVMGEMIDNQELLDQQYEIVSGKWPENENEVVLVVSKDNQISRMSLYMLGLLDQSKLEGIMKDLMAGKEYTDEEVEPYTFDELMSLKLMLVNTPDIYEIKENATYSPEGSSQKYPIWTENPDYALGNLEEFLSEKGMELKISGIIRPRADATAASISTPLAYTHKLTEKILKMTDESAIVNQQKATPEHNVLTGLKYERTHYTPQNINELINKIDKSTMEQFYSVMASMILANPEFSNMLTVTEDNFAGMFMMMPDEKQAEILKAILETDGVKSIPDSPFSPLNIIFTSVTSMGHDGKITVNKDNVVSLLPILEPQQIYFMLDVEGAKALLPPQYASMIPDTMPDLVSLAGDEAMNTIYAEMTTSMKTMTITDEVFTAILSTMKEDDEAFKQLEATLYEMAVDVDASYDGTLEKLGFAYEAAPASINFYPKDFNSKEELQNFITEYNNSVEDADKIEYTDLVGALMSSVTIIIDVISYVLIAFVSISLIVSSIMIGIITNISVLERTKEIGILRAIGASKKDVSRVFNAETFIVGLAAGILGIVVTLILCVPANAIIYALTGFSNVKAVLPPLAAVILIIISMLLTMLAGLIPARSASKKDPVVALRTE